MSAENARPCLAPLLRELQTRVLHDCVDRWASDGFVDSTGLFVEQMDKDGTPRPDVPTRCMVQARQIFSLCTAARLTGDMRHLPKVELALRRLRASFLIDDGRRGCVFSVNPDTSTSNPVRDTYAHAFVILAIVEATRALGDRSLLLVAERILTFMDTSLSAGGAWGYLPDDSAKARDRRLQNPHMHLLESVLAAAEVSQKESFIVRADAIVRLATDVMYQHSEGVLPEVFDALWVPITRGASLQWEPGHHFEWAWLLDWHAKLCSQPRAALAQRLFDTALRAGCMPGWGVVDEVSGMATPTDARYRLWPQTEFLKAAAAFGTTEDVAFALRDSMCLLLERMLRTAAPGCWHDRLDSTGRPTADGVPASSLYHLVMAMTEAARLQETLAASG